MAAGGCYCSEFSRCSLVHEVCSIVVTFLAGGGEEDGMKWRERMPSRLSPCGLV